MREIIQDREELEFDINSPKNNPNPSIINKYIPFKIKKHLKKASLGSIIIIFLEISFILITFFWL